MRALTAALLLCLGCAATANRVASQRHDDFAEAMQQLRSDPTQENMKRVLGFCEDRPKEFGDYLAGLPRSQRRARVGEGLIEGYLVKGKAERGHLYMDAFHGTMAFPVDKIDPIIHLLSEEP